MIVGPFEAKGVGQMSKISNEGTEISNGIFGIFNDRTRFIVLALTTICLTLGMCNGTALHFTVICMKQPIKEEAKNWGVEMTETEAAFLPSNGTTTTINSSSSQTSFPTKIAPINPLQMPMFTFEQQGWLFSALALGTLLSSLATDFLCNLLGFRLLTTLFGLASGLATFGTPFASWLPMPSNFYALFIARLAQGFVLALSFVAAGKLSARWCPISESTLFIGVVSTHFTLGRMITMPMAGLLCESPFGWPSVYFLLGAFTVAFFLIFFWFFRDFPEMHRKVSNAELMRISSGRVEMENGSKRESNVAENREWKYYMELLFDPAVWALFISDFGIVLGNQLFAQYGPIYLKNAIGLSTQKSGFIAALPFLLAAIVATIVSRLCDQFLGGKPKLVVILTTAFPQYLMAICYLALAFLPISQPLLIQSFFTLVIIFPGIWFVGIVKHVQLIAQNRPQSLLAFNSAVAYFFIMLVPTFVNLLIGQEDAADNGKWGRVFLAVASAQMFSALVVQISVQFFKNNKN